MSKRKSKGRWGWYKLLGLDQKREVRGNVSER